MSITTLAKIYEPRALAALLAAFADIRSALEIGELERLIAAGDFDRVLAAMGLDGAAFRQFEEALAQAFAASGDELAQAVPRITVPATSTRLLFRFDMRDARAEAWLRQFSSTLVTRIVETQREAIREVLRVGLEVGDNPRRTALNIAGRYDSATRRRVGGTVGLSAPQARYVRNMRAELADPATMGNYFTRELRDRRFDSVVRKAMEAGVPVPAAQIDRLATRYSDRLSQHRAETIARTETLTALRASRVEAARQLVATGAVRPSQVRKEWDSSGEDGRTRESHLQMEGAIVALEQPFMLPSGATLMYPGDTSMGAPGEETINCRCVQKIRIDFMKGVQ